MTKSSILASAAIALMMFSNGTFAQTPTPENTEANGPGPGAVPPISPPPTLPPSSKAGATTSAQEPTKTPEAPASTSASTASAPVMPKCKEVTVTRPDVGALNKFTITIKDVELEAIKGCNPKAEEVAQTPYGVLIAVTYGPNGANISLPSTMQTGNVGTGRCVNDRMGNVVDGLMYKANWEGDMPPKIELTKLDKAFYDYQAQLETCRKLNAERKHH